jgi:hypothetical protein
MVLRFRVSLPGIKGFARVYNVNADTTLYSFHKQMRSDMEFPQDQLILFKALDENGGVVARYGLFDLGFGTADKVTVSDAVAKGIASFVYFYDVLNKKSVIVTYEGEVVGAKPVTVPMLVETKGPIPAEFENGYVAFEDLPEDQKHVPGEAEWDDAKGEKDEDDDLPSASSDDDDDEDEDEDDDDDAEDEHDDEDGKEIFDGTEDLTL